MQRRDVADDERFADLGGDSLSAVRVLVAIHERFRCDLPPGSLHLFTTLLLLADCVDRAVPGHPVADSVIVFKPGGKGCPIFFVAGLDGSASKYEVLSARIASRHPCYGLSAPFGLSNTSGVSVESMAARHVADIERIVPGGKVVLVGYSFGGTIAFEIARQLQHRGLIDPLPIVIDMPALNASGEPRTLGRHARNAIKNLQAWAAYEAAHFRPQRFLVRAYGQFGRMARALGSRTTAQVFDPRIYFGKWSLPDAYHTFLTNMYLAMVAYVPGRYEGGMILLRAKAPNLFRTNDPKMGWQALAAAGVEVHPIPGRHDDCVSERYAPELASVLVGCAAGFESSEHALVSRVAGVSPLTQFDENIADTPGDTMSCSPLPH